MPHRVALAAWETYERPAYAETEGPEEFGRDLGLDAMKPWEIYETVGREAMVTGASDDTRMAEVRKRMHATVRWRTLSLSIEELKIQITEQLQNHYKHQGVVNCGDLLRVCDGVEDKLRKTDKSSYH